MKKIFLVFGLLWLTACITVEDYGPYWAKAGIDPKLLGKWESDLSFPNMKPEHYEVTDKDGSYRIDFTEAKSRPNYKPLIARTLKDGDYDLLITGPAKGVVMRYVLDGSTAKLFTLDAVKVHDYLKAHPIKSITARVCSTRCPQEAVDILKFDEESLKILAELPQDFWVQDKQYKRQ